LIGSCNAHSSQGPLPVADPGLLAFQEAASHLLQSLICFILVVAILFVSHRTLHAVTAVAHYPKSCSPSCIALVCDQSVTPSVSVYQHTPSFHNTEHGPHHIHSQVKRHTPLHSDPKLFDQICSFSTKST